VKVVTWNVNSLKARLPRVLELLHAHDPDVVCLQETKSSPEAFPHAALEDAGYVAADHGAGRWAGVAILGRVGSPPSDVVCGLRGEAAEEEARWVEATVDDVRVASVYVPNGRQVDTEPYLQKLQFLEAMQARVAAWDAPADGPLLVAGDVNVCPTDLDLHDPALVGSTHITEPERARLRAVLGAGLVDAFRELHPDEPGYTWWDYRAGHFHKGIGLRLDQVLVTPDLAERLETCGIDRGFRKGAKPSDHAPLLATFG
jgi:exodeoxyribonuclease III